MRPWTAWAAKTAVFSLAAGVAATAGGTAAAWAAPGSGAAWAARGGEAGVTQTSAGQGATQASAGQAATQAGLRGGATQAGLPSDVCSEAGALLGIVGAACQSVTSVSAPAAAPGQAGQTTGQPAVGTGRAAASQGSGQGSSQATSRGASQGTVQGAGQRTVQDTTRSLGTTVGQVVRRAVAPLTAVLGASGSAPVLKTVPALAPVTAAAGDPSSPGTGADGTSAPGADRTRGNTPARAGDTNVPAATQLAGLGALPGLADLPSAGPAGPPAHYGASGGGIPMPGTALSAASSGMSSDSFAALAVGALLAGASALKIAGRRTRDRKAGIGVAQ